MVFSLTLCILANYWVSEWKIKGKYHLRLVFLHSISYNLIFVCTKALAYIFWARSQGESFCLFPRLHGAPVLARTKQPSQAGTATGILNPPQAWCPVTPPALDGAHPPHTPPAGPGTRDNATWNLINDTWCLPRPTFHHLGKGMGLGHFILHPNP